MTEIRQASQITTPSTPPAPKPPVQSDGDAEQGSIVRDVASIGAGALAGAAGGIYGLAEGLVTNGIENFPAHIKAGATVGKSVATPVGGAIGAIATGTIVGLAAVALPAAAILATGFDFALTTAVSTIKHTPAAVVETAKSGADLGRKSLSALGEIGEFVGTAIGGGLGGVAGMCVAVSRGIPEGFGSAKEFARLRLEEIKNLPDMAKATWSALYPGGRTVAGGVGKVAGGVGGAVTATGETVVEGIGNSVTRASQRGKAASDYVAGEKEKQA